MNSAEREQDITIQITRNFADINFSLRGIEKLVKTICTRFGLSKAIISIALVGDLEIRELNTRFLNRNSVTDCLSFDLSDSSKMFELVVNAEMAVRQAKSRGHSSEAELALYITHSLLHQLGFDDSKPAQAKKMHAVENEILQQQGYTLMYNQKP